MQRKNNNNEVTNSSSENRTLEANFHLRLTQAEKDLLQKKAAICSLSPNNFLRKSIREDKIIIEDIEGKREVSKEINKIGVNINQIARVVNMNGNINNQEIEELKKQLEMIIKLVKKKLY